MEVKKNLNGMQRKMLDEIYTEQFKKREKTILDERERGKSILTDKLLKEFAKDKEVKAYLEAGKKFFELAQKLKPKFDKNGVSTSDYITKVPALSVYCGYRNDYKVFPELNIYSEETIRIEGVLAEKKREMRAKIYGVEASYEEVDKEIKELLKDV